MLGEYFDGWIEIILGEGILGYLFLIYYEGGVWIGVFDYWVFREM